MYNTNQITTFNSTYTYTGENIPASVHIAVNKNRVKLYKENSLDKVYLKDGTEFQLEFTNNSDFFIRVLLFLNGEIQKNYLVLRPHEHFYLDRFLDSNKKFKFNTFLTGNDDIAELKEIIKNNGKIKAVFYKQYISTYTYSQFVTSFVPCSSTLYYNANDDYTLNIPEEIETGRIEKGNKSEQKFQKINNLLWEAYPFATYEYQILPESRKIESENKKNLIMASEIRTYCPKCGRRAKKGYNFCPGCGYNFNE